jgi:hypothetical protein
MGRVNHVNNSVHRLWRKSVWKLCTRTPQDLNTLLTDLLTATSQAEEKLKSQAERKKLKDNMTDVWNASRLGFEGVVRLTITPQQRPLKMLLGRAFEHGQQIRDRYKAKYASAVGHEPRAAESAVKKTPPPSH